MKVSISKFVTLVVFSLLWFKSGVFTYRILGISPCNARSHNAIFQPIIKELALRGHTVHVVSHYPLEQPLENYTDFNLKGSALDYTSTFPFSIVEDFRQTPLVMTVSYLLRTIVYNHEKILQCETIRTLLNSKETYDLIITESFVLDMTLGFVHKFKAPFIFLTTSPLLPWTAQFVANPIDPSYIPNYMSRYGHKMTLVERLKNTIEVNFMLAYWKWFIAPLNDGIIRETFGEHVPPVEEIAKNVSLVLTNIHFTVTGVQPTVPAVVEVGGIHIKPSKKLPMEIEKFIESSPHGVVYFCMGSLLKATTLPEEKKTAFVYAFSQLKERVLWKFEDEIASYSENVMIKKWMPQRDILAHPKVKLFISHGGMMGTLEAVSAGKPILGIPMFADQIRNILFLEARGVAKRLDYDSINNQTVLNLIRELLKSEYSEKAMEVSKEFHDRPMSPLDTAIYWIEYVIKHKGATHLRSSAVDMPFYKYLLLDVIFFMLVLLISVLFTLKKCLQFLRRQSSKNETKQKQH